MEKIQNLLDYGLVDEKCFDRICRVKKCGINYDSDNFFVGYEKVFEMLGKEVPLKPECISHKKGEKISVFKGTFKNWIQGEIIKIFEEDKNIEKRCKDSFDNWKSSLSDKKIKNNLIKDDIVLVKIIGVPNVYEFIGHIRPDIKINQNRQINKIKSMDYPDFYACVYLMSISKDWKIGAYKNHHHNYKLF